MKTYNKSIFKTVTILSCFIAISGCDLKGNSPTSTSSGNASGDATALAPQADGTAGTISTNLQTQITDIQSQITNINIKIDTNTTDISVIQQQIKILQQAQIDLNIKIDNFYSSLSTAMTSNTITIADFYKSVFQLLSLTQININIDNDQLPKFLNAPRGKDDEGKPVCGVFTNIREKAAEAFKNIRAKSKERFGLLADAIDNQKFTKIHAAHEKDVAKDVDDFHNKIETFIAAATSDSDEGTDVGSFGKYTSDRLQGSFGLDVGHFKEVVDTSFKNLVANASIYADLIKQKTVESVADTNKKISELVKSGLAKSMTIVTNHVFNHANQSVENMNSLNKILLDLVSPPKISTDQSQTIPQTQKILLSYSQDVIVKYFQELGSELDGLNDYFIYKNQVSHEWLPYLLKNGQGNDVKIKSLAKKITILRDDISASVNKAKEIDGVDTSKISDSIQLTSLIDALNVNLKSLDDLIVTLNKFMNTDIAQPVIDGSSTAPGGSTQGQQPPAAPPAPPAPPAAPPKINIEVVLATLKASTFSFDACYGVKVNLSFNKITQTKEWGYPVYTFDQTAKWDATGTITPEAAISYQPNWSNPYTHYRINSNKIDAYKDLKNVIPYSTTYETLSPDIGEYRVEIPKLENGKFVLSGWSKAIQYDNKCRIILHKQNIDLETRNETIRIDQYEIQTSEGSQFYSIANSQDFVNQFAAYKKQK